MTLLLWTPRNYASWEIMNLEYAQFHLSPLQSSVCASLKFYGENVCKGNAAALSCEELQDFSDSECVQFHSSALRIKCM